MLPSTRQKFVTAAVNTLMVSVGCSVSQAQNILSVMDGLKLSGTELDVAKGYVRQLLYKMGIIPGAVGTKKVEDYLTVRSIMTDVPDDAKTLCNPTFPFIAQPHLVSDAKYVANGPWVESSFIPSTHISGQPPRRHYDFYYVEQFMPENMYVMVSNSTVEKLLSSGMPPNDSHPILIWPSKIQAQDAFVGNLDGMHNSSKLNKITDGTLMAIATDYIHRDPKHFFPLNRKGRFVAMNYTLAIPGRAFQPVTIDKSSNTHIRSVYDAKS